jgi:tetratricopeptide (TPR) repeat protein
LGRYDESIAAFSAAMAVDPRDSAPSSDRAITRFLAGQLDAAEADLRRSLRVNPADDYAAAYLTYLLMFRDGEPGTALDAVRAGSQFVVVVRIQALTFQRRYPAALAVADAPGATGVGGEGDLASAVARAQALDYMGKGDAARQLLLPKMAGYRREVAALPVNSSSSQLARFLLATAEALVGNEARALRLTAQGLQLLPPEKDLAGGSLGLGHAARVYGLMGRVDLLLPMLARIRALDGTDTVTSAAILRRDPVWDKVRADPRFQAEIARFAEKQAALAKRDARAGVAG